MVVMLGFQFYPVCNFGRFINLGFGTVISERATVHVCTQHPKIIFYQFVTTAIRNV